MHRHSNAHVLASPGSCEIPAMDLASNTVPKCAGMLPAQVKFLSYEQISRAISQKMIEVRARALALTIRCPERGGARE